MSQALRASYDRIVPSGTEAIRPSEPRIKLALMGLKPRAELRWPFGFGAESRHRINYLIILRNISSLTSTRIASISLALGEQSQVIIEAGTSTGLSADCGI